MLEVAFPHVSDVRLRSLAPLAHRMRVIFRIALHGSRRAAIGITLTQHRVHRAAKDLRIAVLDRLLVVVARGLRIVREVIALPLQLGDAGDELGHRRRNVRQLDDVRAWVLRERAEQGKVVRHPLFFCQTLGESSQGAGRQRDVAQRYVDVGGAGELLDDRQERMGGECGGFVSVGIDNARRGHCSSSRGKKRHAAAPAAQPARTSSLVVAMRASPSVGSGARKAPSKRAQRYH